MNSFLKFISYLVLLFFLIAGISCNTKRKQQTINQVTAQEAKTDSIEIKLIGNSIEIADKQGYNAVRPFAYYKSGSYAQQFSIINNTTSPLTFNVIDSVFLDYGASYFSVDKSGTILGADVIYDDFSRETFKRTKQDTLFPKETGKYYFTFITHLRNVEVYFGIRQRFYFSTYTKEKGKPSAIYLGLVDTVNFNFNYWQRLPENISSDSINKLVKKNMKLSD